MKTCSQCKTELPDEARFCLTCGAPQTGAAASAAARDGAIAQGAGATALGAGAVQVGGNVGGNVITGDNNTINPDPEKERLARARERYLRRLQQQCNVLPLAAMGGDEGVGEELSLEKVYVALDTTTRATLTEAEEKARFDREDRPFTALEAATQERRLALLGDPGGGKSTFVRQLAAQTAAAALAGKAP